VIQAGDAYKSMSAICTENGFKSESYTLVTQDGYALGLWRIPGSLSEESVLGS
jgi:hypothetical protein